MSMINKEVSDFRTYAFHENDFKFVSKEDILGKWSVFFFYPADFTFVHRYPFCPQSMARYVRTNQENQLSHAGRPHPYDL